MKKPLVRFVIELADTPENNETWDDFSDSIAVMDEVAAAIKDLGFDKITIHEF